MKLALVLLFCLVSVSYQQRPWMPSSARRSSYYISPRLLLDYIYANQQYAEEDQFNNEQMSHDYPADESDWMAQGRVPSNSLNKQSKFFFAPLALNQLFNSAGLVTTTTKTVLATTTLTTTVASVQSCIGLAQFVSVAGGGNNPSVTSTLPCARRRRWAQADEEELKLQEVPVQPSPVQMLEPTNAPSNLVEVRIQPDIESSQEVTSSNSHEESITKGTKRSPRALWSVVSTITSTITSYSFVPTAIKKSFTLAAAAALSCLPVGYTVC